MTLTLIEKGETYVVFARDFAAPPEALFRAHTDPAIVQRWSTGPEGGTMPVCDLDARPGGRFHYGWEHEGYSFHAEGEFIAIDPPNRIVHVERMHLPQPDGSVMVTPENRIETSFTPTPQGCRMVMRMTVPDSVSLGHMLESGMEGGMEASYARLEPLLAA